ncbi:hypothetical protein ACFRAR_32190 [Kitasatospora sp. NPDC056651]|uniref:hypothetical protein n=1 Tax=Kitasatospora sp. NPDC056651 TaxID=3345892 RepID=UPI0036CEFFDA
MGPAHGGGPPGAAGQVHARRLPGSGFGFARGRRRGGASVTELGWPEQRYHLETPGLFLLLGGSEDTGVMTMLPKRGVEDSRRLVELIDRHAKALVLD